MKDELAVGIMFEKIEADLRLRKKRKLNQKRRIQTDASLFV
jgi:hypothetical protein